MATSWAFIVALLFRASPQISWGVVAGTALAIFVFLGPFVYKDSRNKGLSTGAAFGFSIGTFFLLLLWLAGIGEFLHGCGIVYDRPGHVEGSGGVNLGEAHWVGVQWGDLFTGLALMGSGYVLGLVLEAQKRKPRLSRDERFTAQVHEVEKQTEGYVSKLGRQTGDTMKFILRELLLSRYRAEYDSDYADKLVASVVSVLLCESTNTQPTLVNDDEWFDEQTLIMSKVDELAKEDSLCRALTCAMYMVSYGKYVDSGRKIGLLSHPLLEYVRALNRTRSNRERLEIPDGFYSKVGSDNVAPLLNLRLLGLYRPLPDTPDSDLMVSEVLSFGKSVAPSIPAVAKAFQS